MNATAAKLTEIAAHLGLSRVAVRDLEIQQIISRATGLDACRLAYIRHLRARRSNTADDRLRLARAKAIEQRTQREANELVRLDEVLAMLDAAIGKLMAHLGSVPARCSRDLTMREIIEREINAARSAAADEYARQAASLRTTGKAAPVKWP